MEEFEIVGSAPNQMGMELCVGDVIAYPITVGSSSRLRYGILKEIRRYRVRNGFSHKFKVRCVDYTGRDEGYALSDRDSVISNCKHAVRVSPNYMPAYPLSLLYTHYSDYRRSLT